MQAYLFVIICWCIHGMYHHVCALHVSAFSIGVKFAIQLKIVSIFCDLYEHCAPAEFSPRNLCVLCLESLHASFIISVILIVFKCLLLLGFHTLDAAYNKSRSRRWNLTNLEAV